MSVEKNALSGMHKAPAHGGPLQAKNRWGGAASPGEDAGGFASMLFALDAPLAALPADALIPGGADVEPATATAATVVDLATQDPQAAMLATAGATGSVFPWTPTVQVATPPLPATPEAVSTVSLGTAPGPGQGMVAAAAAVAAEPAASVAPSSTPATADAHPPAWGLALQDLKWGKSGLDGRGQTHGGDPAAQNPSNLNANLGSASFDMGHGAKEQAHNVHNVYTGRREAAQAASLSALEAVIRKMALSADALEGDRRNGKVVVADLAASAVPPQGAQGAWALHGPVSDPGPTYGSESGVADAGLLAADVPVAEQVSYWVSRDVQNALLRLDGFGAEAVEINITVQGKEAQIDFRTDAPDAREALEGASAQLKDMLSREGLVLSGVSVGTSAQGQAHASAQQRKDQQSARQARVSAASPASDRSVLQPLVTPTRVGDRAVDLFV